MSLKQYIRKDQEFLIYLRGSRDWERYEPGRHGPPDSIRRGYVVAYPNGEILAETLEDADNPPPGTHYIEATGGRRGEAMSRCAGDARVEIRHESSAYHTSDQYYCTRIRNSGEIPFKVRRFAAFGRNFWRYRLGTISNSWFTAEQFRNWFNLGTEWLAPGGGAADRDNYGLGDGYWVFEVEFATGEVVAVQSRLPVPGHRL